MASHFTETLDAIGTVTSRVGHVVEFERARRGPGRTGARLAWDGSFTPAIRSSSWIRRPFARRSRQRRPRSTRRSQASERQQRLAQEGIAPRKDAEQAAADLARARNELDVARRAENLSIIKAPISGVVTRVVATIGSSVDPSQPLIEIADPSSLDIVLSVTPADAGRVHPGARTTLTAGQSQGGEQLGVGTVIDIASTIDSTTRSVAVRVQAPTTRRAVANW